MTPEQRALLEDKADLWRRASKEGSVELRDYNYRAAAALDQLLNERDDCVAVLKRIAHAPAWGAPERWENTPAEVRLLARGAYTSAQGGPQ